MGITESMERQTRERNEGGGGHRKSRIALVGNQRTIRIDRRRRLVLLVTETLLLQLNFPGLLDELTRRAEAGSAAITASSAFDVVSLTDSTTVEHLEDERDTTVCGDTVQEAVA